MILFAFLSHADMVLDAQKRKNLAALAIQKKTAPAPSAKDKKLKVMAKVAPSKDEETCLSFVFKRKRKADTAIPVLSNSNGRAPSYWECPPMPPLPTTLWCRRAKVKALGRETSGNPFLAYLPSYKRCCTLPGLKRGRRIWRRIP